MPRLLRVAAAQVGRTDRGTPRAQVLTRLIALLDEAAAKSVKLVVFPETAFTTFFPRYLFTDEKELDSYFEEEDAETGITNSGNVKPFFDRAAELGVDVVIGYGEKTPEGTSYNTASYVSGGRVVSKYRKSPSTIHPDTTNQLEKRYFKPGNLGFQAFRAPALRHETRSPIGWRCYGLQGVEIMCIGYNTVAWAPELWGADPNMDRNDARENALVRLHFFLPSVPTFCITAARCGLDDGKFELITGSMIVDPEGLYHLDACQQGKNRTFAFEKHRRPEHYGAIVERAGVVEPPEVV
ncbi:carbon-nitrogen hydrolase [Armillaria mellea]|nr:carbon-nitrogen hydrolase [Armillaria mellea]